MAFLKGREIVFKALENVTFLKPKKIEESEQSEQSSSDDKYTSIKLDNDVNTSSNASNKCFSSDLDISLFNLRKEQDLKYEFLKKCFKDYQ